MHISLTPELEYKIKAKVESGLYNNASEVIREALRFMEQNQELIHELKLQRLRMDVAKGAEQAEAGIFSDRSVEDILSSLNQQD
ncbi:MAG TPA: type II toxin-antitoxin system ParD family antitoxin [Chromatiales bacterium]|nr:type II toxin-antitoxin system ParD family antitoxin [Thiotrichales bacterium]HIP68114.1 type II toxin-antitoxin system ParD family antitoxin [Chromatiales bacterium]